MYQDVIGSRDICDLCHMLSHHLNISCIFTSHNIFTAGKFSKTIATNLHCILLGTLRNQLQIATLATQLFCYGKKSRSFVRLYEDHIRENPFSQIQIDLSPISPFEIHNKSKHYHIFTVKYVLFTYAIQAQVLCTYRDTISRKLYQFKICQNPYLPREIWTHITPPYHTPNLESCISSKFVKIHISPNLISHLT